MTEPKIIYEDKDFLVVDKPAGFVVHAPRTKEPKGDCVSHAGVEPAPPIRRRGRASCTGSIRIRRAS